LTLGPDVNGNALRMIAEVQAVARGPVTMELKIFGMLAADMNALTVIFFQPDPIQINTVVLEANNGDGWHKVFTGTIYDASPDYTGLPNAFFRLLANQTYAAQITPVTPLSFPGSASVASIVHGIAGQLQLDFENNGVTAVLNNPYLPGTAMDQLQKVCEASDTDFYFSGETLAISPSGQGRPSVPTTILNPQSGLMGYPVLDQFGIWINCLFNPAITGGGQIQVTGSDIPSANGLWNPIHLLHQLESWNPNGRWLTTLKCTQWGVALPDISA
jgi:hypothetical protein